MLRGVLLGAHVACGGAALLVAGALLLRGGWTGAAGRAYGGLVTAVAVTAVGLAAAGSTLPPAVRALLLVVALATAVAARRGLVLARRGSPGAPRLLWGSVTSLVSALAVVSAPPVVWVPVVLAGTLLTEQGVRRARLRGGLLQPSSPLRSWHSSRSAAAAAGDTGPRPKKPWMSVS